MVGHQRFIDAARDALGRGDTVAADKALRQALCQAPDDQRSHYNIGFLRSRAQGGPLALACYRRALACAPDNVSAASNLADVQLGLGRAGEAEATCLRALRHTPLSGRLMVNLALVRTKMGLRDAACADCRRAVLAEPARTSGWRTLGMLRHDEADEADLAYRRAWVSGGPDAALLVNRGEIAQRDGQIGDAVALYEQALSLRPEDADARANLASAYVDFGDYEAGRRHARAVLAEHPDHRLARWMESWIALSHRDFEHGFAAYDDRWQSPEPGSHPNATRYPLWRGEKFGGSLLLWCEQGLGDEILYAGMIDDVMAHGFDVVLEADPRLVPLFQRSWPSARVIATGEDHPSDVLAQSSTLRLPMIFRRDPRAFPRRRSYLVPDPETVAGYRDSLGRGDADLAVGMAWRSGNPRTAAQKSTRLADWGELLNDPGYRLYSLQYDDGGETHPRLAANPGPDVKTDIDSLAAQIAALDHVVSISGVTAHLAGALGTPGHVLLPPAPLWYWFAEGEDCPWYPSLTLMRRAKDEDWPPAVARVCDAMRSARSA